MARFMTINNNKAIKAPQRGNRTVLSAVVQKMQFMRWLLMNVISLGAFAEKFSILIDLVRLLTLPKRYAML